VSRRVFLFPDLEVHKALRNAFSLDLFVSFLCQDKNEMKNERPMLDAETSSA